MNARQQKRFDALYSQHLQAFKLQGYSASTIDIYSRVVRRLSSHFDCAPDALTVAQLTGYFTDRADSHSWSSVRLTPYSFSKLMLSTTLHQQAGKNRRLLEAQPEGRSLNALLILNF